MTATLRDRHPNLAHRVKRSADVPVLEAFLRTRLRMQLTWADSLCISGLVRRNGRRLLRMSLLGAHRPSPKVRGPGAQVNARAGPPARRPDRPYRCRLETEGSTPS